MGLWDKTINPLNAELNFICHLLTLLEAHRILHVSRIRVNIFRSEKLRQFSALFTELLIPLCLNFSKGVS